MIQLRNLVFVYNGQILDLQPDLRIYGFGSVNVQCGGLTHHHVGQGLGGGILCGYGADVFALPQNGHPVGQLQYLLQLVGNDDNGLAVSTHGPKYIKELFGFLRCQYGSWFVKNEDIGTPVEYLDDLDRLLFRNAHVIDFFVGINIKAVFFADLPDTGVDGLFVEFPGLPKAQYDVLTCGEYVHQLKMLMDHADAKINGVLGGTDGDGLPVHEDLALIGEIDAGDHVHQCGFSAAVFS